jgi:hypothetical protein
MVYFLPNEFMAPANQVVQEKTSREINDDDQLGGLMAQLVLAKQATFDKPAKNRHMRSLYLKGYVNGKPLTKMFVDGGAAVNVMLYTTFRKLGMGPRDLTPMSIILNDFTGNPFRYQGVRPRGSDDWVQDIAHNLLRHRRQGSLQPTAWTGLDSRQLLRPIYHASAAHSMGR